MHFVQSHRSRFLTRVFSVAGLLLFVGAFFVAPLCNALTLCTMPCCHHGSSGAKIAANPMAPCATECAISSSESTIPVAPTVAQSSSAPVIHMDVIDVASADRAIASAVELQRDASPHGLAAPIHLLNSTFRI
jgi:hypothetical protein